MFLGIYNIPALISFLGLFLSVAACFFAFNQCFGFAVICFIGAGICDLFDGLIARKIKTSETENIFGVQIDSIIDMASFGLTPVVMLLPGGFNTLVDYLIFAFYVSCAAMRLAYFNLLSVNNVDKTPVKFYTGLPVTYSALIFPLMFSLKLFVNPELFSLVIRSSFLVVSLLYITKIKVPKPKGVFYIIFPILAILAIGFWASHSG